MFTCRGDETRLTSRAHLWYEDDDDDFLEAATLFIVFHEKEFTTLELYRVWVSFLKSRKRAKALIAVRFS
jgi:hypothetical protein